jgi:predicted nucleotidyltransferase
MLAYSQYMLNDEEDNLIDFLEEQYGCHTVILYGSRAQGTERPDSDWDIIGLTDRAQQIFVHQPVDGVGDVNAYIYPREKGIFNPTAPSTLFSPLDPFIRLQHGKVLVEEDGLGTAIVERATKLARSGPQRITPERRAHIRHYFFSERLDTYFSTTSARVISQAERDYARHDLLQQALFHYYRLRGMWVPDEKQRIRYLEMHDPVMAELLADAERPEADAAELRALSAYVMGEE